MAKIEFVTIEVADVEAAKRFYDEAFGEVSWLRLRASEAASSGFRGFSLALTVPQPGTVDSFMRSATEAGATVLKPAEKSLWGYGGVLQAPDGTIWKIATPAKKDSGPVTRDVDEYVLLLGVEDVKATKRFYAERGLTVAKSFGGKYVEFDAESGPVTLSLYKRRGLAKVAGVAPEGSGSHRLAIGGDAGAFTDPDGYAWEAAAPAAAS